MYCSLCLKKLKCDSEVVLVRGNSLLYTFPSVQAAAMGRTCKLGPSQLQSVRFHHRREEYYGVSSGSSHTVRSGHGREEDCEVASDSLFSVRFPKDLGCQVDLYETWTGQ